LKLHIKPSHSLAAAISYGIINNHSHSCFVAIADCQLGYSYNQLRLWLLVSY